MRHAYYLPLLVLLIGQLSACSSADRRPFSTSFEDEHIEDQAISKINAHHTGIIHVNATSFNRRLLLTGEVPTEASKAEILRIAAEVPNVKNLNNELVVGEIHGIASRSSDSLITSEVKLRFANNGSFHADHVKVVTEAGTVYLMGLLTRNEAASAAELASTSKGVQRVITIFDYLD